MYLKKYFQGFGIKPSPFSGIVGVVMNSNKIVLIVDDSNTVRFQVKSYLEQIEVDLREAGSEIGLFNLIDEYGRPADLILMDLMLKEEDGFDLIKKLKTHEAYNDIPVIVLTQHASLEQVLTAKELGVNGYIKKPINKDSFLEKISDILGLTKPKASI